MLSFVDLEKAFVRVLQDVVWWTMRKLGVEEWLVRVLQAIYTNTRICVKGRWYTFIL